MKKTLILSLSAVGLLGFSVFGAPEVKTSAAPAKPATPTVQIDPFSVLPEKLAEMNGKNITRKEVKSFILSNSPGGKLPEGINAQVVKDHAYELVEDYIQYKLVEQALVKSKINYSEAEIKKMLKEQFDKMPQQYREMMTKQLDMQGMTVEKYINKVASDPQSRKFFNLGKFKESITKDVKVSDAVVKKYYDQHPQAFTSPGDTPDTMRASHILISFDSKKSDGKKELAKANALIAQLKKDPKAFGKLAYENSKCPSGKQSNGSLGSFQKGMMVPEFEKAVIALKPGEITATPVKTQFGYHIIRRDLPQKAQRIPFKTVEPSLRQMLTNHEKEAVWQKYIEALRKNAGVKIFVSAPAPAKAAPATK